MDQATVKISEFTIADQDTPISRIPHEILAMILVYAQPDKLHDLPLGQQHRVRIPFPIEITVSHVSTFWRDVAIDTPSLWTTIHVHPTQSHELMQIYLSRSKTYPLDVVVNPGDFGNILDVRLNMIVSHVDRLRCLHVAGPIQDIYAFLSRFYNLAAPQLKELILRGRGLEWPPYDVNGAPHIFAGGTPALSSLRLTGIGLRTCLPPLSAITSMSLYDIQLSGLWKYTHFLAVLSATPLLAELSIRGLLVDHWDARASGPIHLHSLRSLWLSGTDTHVSYILYSLSLPRIEFLSLNHLTPFVNPNIFQLDSSGTPRFPTVLSLVFAHTISFSRFSLLPSLTHLTILHSNPLFALQEVFTMSTSVTPLPDLKTLTLFPLCRSNWQILCHLVNLRIRQGLPLRKLRLDYDSWSLFPLGPSETLNGQVEVEVLTQAPTDHEMVW